MSKLRSQFAAFVILLALQLTVFSATTFAQATATKNAPRLDYTVSIANAAQHLFHIKTEVSNVSGKTVDLSLPAWTPGWYTIMPYAANVMRLEAKASNGAKLTMRAIDKQTWRVETSGNRTLTIEYDYFANNLSVNGAELNERRGYFLGTNLFLYAVGHTTDTASTIRFELPAGWRVATGLKREAGTNTFTARNFDNLVDCPTVLGDFDEDIVEVRGKPIHIVIDPKGQYNAEQRATLKDLTARVIESQAKMFGGLPYDEYWILWITGPNLKVGGALEHENSTNLMGQALPPDPRFIIGGVSHEHFHVWNVKRLKPAALIPYDYSREQYTRELWVAEGFTSYYTDVHLRRAGIITPEQYLQQQANEIVSLQSNEARKWISAADASVTTWTTYTGGGPFTVNYYNKGLLIGLLMDLELRHATQGKRSLDDLMRALYEQFYQRGKGYTVEDVEKVATAISGKNFKDFFARYVTGTEELDYDAALAHVGLKVEVKKGQQAYFGLQFGNDAAIGGVIAGGSAEQAGVKVGDVLVALNDVVVANDANWLETFRARYNKAGEPLVYKVKRGNEVIELKGEVRTRERVDTHIVEMGTASDVQKALRKGWLE